MFSLEVRSAVTYHRAGSEDAARIVDLYASLSDASRYYRFHQATPRLTPSLRRCLTAVDAGPVWLAMSAGRCVGEARLTPSAFGTEAHLAVAVADSFQRSGIASELLCRVVDDADGGDRAIAVSILPTNTAALGLARRFGARLVFEDGMFDGLLLRAERGRAV